MTYCLFAALDGQFFECATARKWRDGGHGEGLRRGRGGGGEGWEVVDEVKPAH